MDTQLEQNTSKTPEKKRGGRPKIDDKKLTVTIRVRESKLVELQERSPESWRFLCGKAVEMYADNKIGAEKSVILEDDVYQSLLKLAASYGLSVATYLHLSVRGLLVAPPQAQVQAEQIVGEHAARAGMGFPVETTQGTSLTKFPTPMSVAPPVKPLENWSNVNWGNVEEVP